MVRFLRDLVGNPEDWGNNGWWLAKLAHTLKKFPPDMTFEDNDEITISDLMSIACQSDMIPVRDLLENFFANGGRYYGDDSEVMASRAHTVLISLRIPSIMVAGEKDYTMSRWTYIAVDQQFRTRKYDNRMQHYRKHSGV